MDCQAYITKGIKFVYNNEIRKIFSISDYSSMVAKIEETYTISISRFKIWYRDDEDDLITISCEDDFEDSLDFFDGKSIKLFIEPKAAGLMPGSNMMSTINPNYNPRPNVSLAESTTGLKEMNLLNNEIEFSRSSSEAPKVTEEAKEYLTVMPKEELKTSINKSEGSAFDFGVYDRDIDETNDLINEITLQLEDLQGTFDQMTHKQKQRELQRLKIESEAKAKLEQELRAKTEIQLEQERKARVEEEAIETLKREREAELVRNQIIEAEKQWMEEEFNLQRQKMAKKLYEKNIKRKSLEILKKSVKKIVKNVRSLTDSDGDDETPIANRNARKHEINVLKELEAGKYQKIIHLKIKCNICNTDNILGFRYLCIECDDFNICSNCERVVIHHHPLLKFKTPEDFINFLQNLKGKRQEQQKVVREEQKSPELDISKPIIVCHSFGDDTGATEYLSKQWGAICTKVMPMSGHIISPYSDSIYVSVTIMNTGKVDWPVPHHITCLNMHCSAYDCAGSYKSVQPGQEVAIEVIIKNPGSIGHFDYIFSLADNLGKSFGTVFSFDFEVKESIFSNEWRAVKPCQSSYPSYPNSQWINDVRTRRMYEKDWQQQFQKPNSSYPHNWPHEKCNEE